jgi:hypothetical protein
MIGKEAKGFLCGASFGQAVSLKHEPQYYHYGRLIFEDEKSLHCGSPLE